MIKSGDKVMCINDKGWINPRTLEETQNGDPVKGQVLTVEFIKEVPEYNFIGLVFVEIATLDENGDRESYDIEYFRKLVPHSFRNDTTEMLSTSPLIKEGIERIVVEPEYV